MTSANVKVHEIIYCNGKRERKYVMSDSLPFNFFYDNNYDNQFAYKYKFLGISRFLRYI